MMSKKSTLSTPSVLAFERKIDVSDAYFWQMLWDGEGTKTPVRVREKSVRGTISHRLKNMGVSDPAKLDAEIEKANLQTVDTTFLDDGYDTLVATFTCKVLPFTGQASICNNSAYQEKLTEIVKKYQKESDEYAELAKRYAINLINARWLWRNRLGAESVTVIVTYKEKRLEFVQAHKLSLKDFDYRSSDELDQLVTWIQEGLTGKAFTLLHVEARAKVGNGQEVFPSQELILDADKNSKNSKTKVLYRVGNEQDQAGMHSQKIANAIRTIDNWYEEAEFPIAVESYGSVTSLGKAYRKKQNFYNLLDNWMIKEKTPEKNQQHYVMAMLIRGGVFGESGSSKKD